MTLKVLFTGFWGGFHDSTNAVDNRFFLDLMSKVYNEDTIVTHNIDEADVLIENTQVQDSLKYRKNWKHTFLFSGESYIRHDKDEYSCVLYGQRNHKNIVNVPPFISYVYSSLGIDFLNESQPQNKTSIPPKDVLVVISNPGGVVRNTFIDALENSGLQITFGGHYKNNTNGPITHYYNSLEFNEIVKQHKFMIAMENSEEDTYITEKVIHGIRAGIVPVYWGSKRIHDYISKERIITLNNSNEIYSAISIMKNMTDEEWLHKVNSNSFTDFTKEQFTVEKIASQIRNIILPKEHKLLSHTVMISNKSFEPERYSRLVDMCDKHGIHEDNRKFICPTYKHLISDEDIKKYVTHDYLISSYNRCMRKGEVSLILNFKEVFEYIEKTFRDGIFLILESDANVYEDFNNFNNCLNKLQNKEWSAISLGRSTSESLYGNSYCNCDTPYRKLHQLNTNIIVENTKEDISTPEDKDVRFLRKFHTRCTDSHLFSYKGVKQFLEYMKNDPNCGAPFDYMVMRLTEQNINFKYYWSTISYFEQSTTWGNEKSTIQNT